MDRDQKKKKKRSYQKKTILFGETEPGGRDRKGRGKTSRGKNEKSYSQ